MAEITDNEGLSLEGKSHEQKPEESVHTISMLHLMLSVSLKILLRIKSKNNLSNSAIFVKTMLRISRAFVDTGSGRKLHTDPHEHTIPKCELTHIHKHWRWQ